MRSNTVPRAVVALLAILLIGGCSSDKDAPDGSEGSRSTAEPTAVDKLMDRGLGQVQKEQYGDARGTFESILTLDPKNAFATYNLGFIAQREGQDPKAVELYAKATQLDPQFAPPLYNLAILTEASDLDAAAAFYRRVLELEPEDAPTMMRLGFLLQHQGKTDEGQQLLDQGIELDPTMQDVPAPSYPKES